MALKFAILYEGKAAKEKKIIKTVMSWPEDKVLEILKKHFSISQDIDKAFKSTIKEFKRQSTKIP